MRGLWMIGAAALFAGCAGCVGTPRLSGLMGVPPFAALQQMCGARAVDYGKDAQGVYATFFDAYVASRRGRVSKDDYCAFQTSIAQHYATLGTSSDSRMRNQWVMFFTDQRAQALSWRAAVDPTLRGG